MKDDDLLKEIRDNLKFAIEAETDNRDSAKEDIDFENGNQWDDATRTQRETDGRPCITINNASGVIKQITGDSRQNKIQIKVRPVDDESDVPVAQTLTGIIRNIENVSNSDVAYQNALSCSARGGIGYIRVVTDYLNDDVFEQDIEIRRVVNPFSVYFDPKCEEVDFSDAKWCFVTSDMDKDDFEKEYPDAKTTDNIQTGEGEKDRWFSENHVRVAEYFKVDYKSENLLLLRNNTTVKESALVEGSIVEGPEGERGVIIVSNDTQEIVPVIKERKTKCRYIKWYKTNGFEILESEEWAGKYIPIVPVLGDEVWIDGKRVLRSAIKWAKEPGRLYNWARSTSVESMAMAAKSPYLATPEQIEGHEHEWETAHRKNRPYLLYNQTGQGAPQRQQSSIPDMGATQEAMQAKDDIKSATGIYDASLGARGNETSGKAIVARQRQGDTATYLFTDNLVAAINHVGRILVDLIPKIYDTERVVRLLNSDGSEGWATINKEDASGNKINDITLGKYDVVVTAGPAFQTKRIEALEGMTALAQAAPAYMPVLAPRIAKNMDFPDADEISEEMKALTGGGQEQQPNPEDQMKMQKGALDIEGKQLDNTKKKGDIMGGIDEVVQNKVMEALISLGMVK